MAEIILYGIPNCDTVKKAQRWLGAHSVPYTFHNYKTSGIDKAKIAGWVKVAGWKQVLNIRSSTYKKLLQQGQPAITNAAAAIRLMMEYTSSIKRPILCIDDKIIVGFNEIDYIDTFKTTPYFSH